MCHVWPTLIISYLLPEKTDVQQTRWDSQDRMNWCLLLSFQWLTLERIIATVVFGPIYLWNCLLTELKVLRLTVFPLSDLLKCFSQSFCFHTFVLQAPFIRPFPLPLNTSLAFPPIISGVMAASQHLALTWALGSGGSLDCSTRWQSSAQPWTQSSKRWQRRRETMTRGLKKVVGAQHLWHIMLSFTHHFVNLGSKQGFFFFCAQRNKMLPS